MTNSPEYYPEELEEFVDLRAQLLEEGFSDCEVRMPTKSWHGVRIKAFVELDKNDPLPFIQTEIGMDRLIVWTLSGINHEIGLGSEDSLPSRLGRFTGKDKLLPEITIDTDIKERMDRMAWLGRELAYMGLGFPKEYPWIKPMDKIDEQIVLCDNNEVRRYKESADLASQARWTHWKNQGWMYYINWPRDDLEASVSISRYTEFNPEEGSLDDCLLVVRCTTDQKISAHLSPDWGPICPVSPVGPLSLEELAVLQAHTKLEIEEGLLSPKYTGTKSS